MKLAEHLSGSRQEKRNYINYFNKYPLTEDFPNGSVARSPTCNAGGAGDLGSIPGWERSLGGGHGDPPQYSCLENPMD